MRKLIYSSLTVAAVVLLMTACKGATERELQQQVDSLKAAYEEQKTGYDDMSSYVNLLAQGLDSIAVQEGMIFTEGESPNISREQLTRNLSAYKQTLAQQRERIAELEKKLKKGDANAAAMQTIINSLKKQVEEKDAEVELLRTQVNDKSQNIQSLLAYIKRLRDRNQNMAERLTVQQTTIETQDQSLNEAFIKIGPKEELKKLGLLTGGGLLKKSKVDFNQMDKSLFSRKDIRKVNHIEMLSKKAKVLTPQPTDSYEIEVAEGNAVLVITNPQKFWSITNYLIIQTD